MFYNILQILIITGFFLYSLAYLLRCFLPKEVEKWAKYLKFTFPASRLVTTPCGRATQCTACNGCGLAKLKQDMRI